MLHIFFCFIDFPLTLFSSGCGLSVQPLVNLCDAPPPLLFIDTLYPDIPVAELRVLNKELNTCNMQISSGSCLKLFDSF